MDSIVFTRIKELCAERGITITKLESLMGMSQSTIGKWRTATPTVDKLLKVAQYFHVSLDYLTNQTNIASPNLDIRATCILTGLSEESVTNLTKLSQSEDSKDKAKLLTVNQLLEDDGIEEWGTYLLQSISNFICLKPSPDKLVMFPSGDFERTSILYDQVLKNRVLKAMEDLRYHLNNPQAMVDKCGSIREDIWEKQEEESNNGKPQDNN